MVEGAREGLEVRELGKKAPPLDQAHLPQVDEPLAERGVDPVQLALGRVYGYLSGANFHASPVSSSRSGCRASDSATRLRKSLRLSMKAVQ